MNRFALTSALILALSAPAFADGKSQLAAQLGVNDANYTLAQLIRLDTAVQDRDAAEIAFIKAQAEGRITASDGIGNPGQAMLAATLGVNASDYTLAQLTRLDTAVRGNDTQEIAFIKAEAGGRVLSTQGTNSPGDAQLAAQLGVNVANYSTSELVSKYLSDN
jgi:hypothetical protein